MKPVLIASSAVVALVATGGSVHRLEASAQLTDASSPAASCGAAAFLTFESGALAAVDWVEYTGSRVHTRAIATQSQIMDATIDLRADGTAWHSTVTLANAESEKTPMINSERDLGDGAVYWSPRLASALEQTVARARVIGQPSVAIPGASLYSSARSDLTVERVDDTNWAVHYRDRSLFVGDKRYLVATDARGCLLSATMPDYGVVIERRTQFPASAYPLWAPYAAPPDAAYRATEVRIRAPQGHVLAGTLTTPRRQTRVPAAVLITGLSQHERNNGNPPWMPFRDLADALTRAGIAVLRVDDRGIGKSTGDIDSFTISDKAEDVRTEVGWLRAQPGVDPHRIMLVGYSEGGLIAPIVAAADTSIAAVIALAGPGVSGMDVARYQVEQPILRNPDIVASDRPTRIAADLADALKDLSPHETSFMNTDPLEYDSKVKCPTLVIQGGADATVPVRSAQRIAAAMRSGGNDDVTVRIVPGVSHSLMPDPEGLSGGWAALPALLTAPAVLDEVVRWSASRLLAAKPRRTP